MKKDIYFICLARKTEDGSIVYEEDLQFFDKDFSITTERCQEICKDFQLSEISFMKIGSADLYSASEMPCLSSEERIHYEVNHNELQK